MPFVAQGKPALPGRRDAFRGSG